MSSALQTRLRSFAPIPLRLLLGLAFIYHGYPKVFTAAGHDSFAGMLTGIGIPLSGLAAYLIGAFELFGGMLLVLGVGVRAVAALGVVEMVVAAVTVHMPAGFNFLNVTGTTPDGGLEFGMPGYEVNVLYIAGFLSLLISGAGRFSLPRASAKAEHPDGEQGPPEAARRREPHLADVG